MGLNRMNRQRDNDTITGSTANDDTAGQWERSYFDPDRIETLELTANKFSTVD